MRHGQQVLTLRAVGLRQRDERAAEASPNWLARLCPSRDGRAVLAPRGPGKVRERHRAERVKFANDSGGKVLVIHDEEPEEEVVKPE